MVTSMTNALRADNEFFNELNADIDTLAHFVPLTELSAAHIRSISRSAKFITAPVGQPIGDIDMLKENYLFLLSGEMRVSQNHLQREEVYQASDFGMLSVGDFLPDANGITAQSDCQIVVIERNELDSMLCWDQIAKSLLLELSAEREYDEDREWIQTLLMSNLFHKIPPYNIRGVLDKFEPRIVQSGEVILREHERGDECYLIKEGRAVVTRYDDATSSQLKLAELSAGECFGEDALVNMTLRNATVTMESNGVLMVLKKREFLSLMDEPKVETVPESVASEQVAGGAKWLDVRSQQEYDYNHKPDAFHMPLHLMSIKSRLMDDKTQYFAYCSTGRRATTASYLLQQQGLNVMPVNPLAG